VGATILILMYLLLILRVAYSFRVGKSLSHKPGAELAEHNYILPDHIVVADDRHQLR